MTFPSILSKTPLKNRSNQQNFLGHSIKKIDSPWILETIDSPRTSSILGGNPQQSNLRIQATSQQRRLKLHQFSRRRDRSGRGRLTSEIRGGLEAPKRGVETPTKIRV